MLWVALLAIAKLKRSANPLLKNATIMPRGVGGSGKTTLVLWKLAQSIQQSETCLFGKLLNFVDEQWETVAFSPRAVTIPYSPSSVIMEVLSRQNRTWRPAGSCGWRWGSLNLEWQMIPTSNSFINRSNDHIAMQAGHLVALLTLRLQSSWNVQLSGRSEAAHMQRRDQRGPSCIFLANSEAAFMCTGT